MQLNIVTFVLSKKEKLVRRFLDLPADFRYSDLRVLLADFGYTEVPRGKTSGSRVKFVNCEGTPIFLHKPHPGGILKRYQLKQVKELLGL